MKVILTTNVKNIGLKGEEKDVKPGFARNFLFPKKLAVIAESAIGQKIKIEKDSAEQKKDEISNEISEIILKNQGMKLEFKHKTSKEGKLFAGVNADEIKAAAENKLGVKISQVTPNSSIKELGDHDIIATFKDGQSMNLVVSVVKE